MIKEEVIRTLMFRRRLTEEQAEMEYNGIIAEIRAAIKSGATYDEVSDMTIELSGLELYQVENLFTEDINNEKNDTGRF